MWKYLMKGMILSMNKSGNVIGKTIAFVIIFSIDLWLCIAFISVFKSDIDEDDITGQIHRAQEYYYEGNYSDLIEYVDLYELYNEDMALYKEAADAYILKQQCCIFDSEETQQEYNEAYNRLVEMRENCQPGNEEILDGFIEQAQR